LKLMKVGPDGIWGEKPGDVVEVREELYKFALSRGCILIGEIEPAAIRYREKLKRIELDLQLGLKPLDDETQDKLKRMAYDNMLALEEFVLKLGGLKTVEKEFQDTHVYLDPGGEPHRFGVSRLVAFRTWVPNGRGSEWFFMAYHEKERRFVDVTDQVERRLIRQVGAKAQREAKWDAILGEKSEALRA